MSEEQTRHLINALTNLTQAVNMIGGSAGMSFQAKADFNALLSKVMQSINHAVTSDADPTLS